MDSLVWFLEVGEAHLSQKLVETYCVLYFVSICLYCATAVQNNHEKAYFEAFLLIWPMSYNGCALLFLYYLLLEFSDIVSLMYEFYHASYTVFP